MTANPTPPEQAPRIFGRELVRQEYPGRPLYVIGVAFVHQRLDGRWVGEVQDVRDLETRFCETADDAARDLESRVRELVLTLAPLLDDAGKREIVKAAGIKLSHFPEDTTPREFEGEPEPIA